ncbi:3-oxoacyl-ACP synthase III family protein [Kutzneria sp. NPDC052558]|uniref:3-oxoacyl-ACP synthase III family protein n=1 Tax=Kutzneria sp. NPDC052558 TaxID=3364121 RepID=UPI0037CC1CEC
MNVSIRGVTAYLPPTLVTNRQVESRITGFIPRPGAIAKLSGVRTRHRADPGEQASDLAVHAAEKLLFGLGVAACELDLIVFAAAAQDLGEPATAHVVAAKLGASCPVFDVKNACNSFLNGIQVAEAFISGGQYRRILVCSGETGTRVARWTVADREQFADSLAGYTLSDAGAAVLLETSLSGGIFYRDFTAESANWHVSSIPGTGCAEDHDAERDGYIRGDGRALLELVAGDVGPQLDRALTATGLRREDFALFCVHQVSTPYLRALTKMAELPEEKLVATIADHGNVASCTIPLQLSLAIESGRCGPGDKVAFIGLAGGTSIGVMFVEL